MLRISNLTDSPVRVALLPQKPSATELPAYEPPAHWDFDPEEGQIKGLLVGLPNRPSLKVKPGEVLVAFALDGSAAIGGRMWSGRRSFPTGNRRDRSGNWCCHREGVVDRTHLSDPFFQIPGIFQRCRGSWAIGMGLG